MPRNRTKKTTVEIENFHLWIMLCGYARYAMGRRSTAPSMAHDMIKQYGKQLSAQQLVQLRREIKEELETYERANRTCGDECDHNTWKAVVMSLDGLILVNSAIDPVELQRQEASR